MGHTHRDVLADENERTTGKLTTPAEREAFVERVAKAMEAASKALLETADRLRADPEGMLARAYEPNITSMFPRAVAKLEAIAYDNGVVRLTGTTIIDGSRFNEVAFSANWSETEIKPVPDNRIGV